MKSSSRISLLGKIADKLGFNDKFSGYTSVDFDQTDSAIISPVDAKVMHIGNISQNGLLISKNEKNVSLTHFIGDYYNQFLGGKYINFYLNPANKHFWITPCDGKFIYTKKNDGKSWLPVFMGLENLLGIEMFSKAVEVNASVGSVFLSRNFLLALIALGSLNVNRIHIDYEEMQDYKKGTPCGYFSIGSSFLICFPNYLNVLIEEKNKVQIGQRILI